MDRDRYPEKNSFPFYLFILTSFKFKCKCTYAECSGERKMPNAISSFVLLSITKERGQPRQMFSVCTGMPYSRYGEEEPSIKWRIRQPHLHKLINVLLFFPPLSPPPHSPRRITSM